MSYVVLFVVMALTAGLAAIAGFVWTRSQMLKESRQRLAQFEARQRAQLEAVSKDTREQRARAEKDAQDKMAELEARYKAQLEAVTKESRSALVRVDAAARKVSEVESQLKHAEQENDWLRGALDERPYIEKKTYKVITVGIRSTGKTSLTLKWANPLIDLGMVEGTKIERYERTVSKSRQKEVMTEHVFEIGDWGGEHIVDAQQELVTEEIHGLLFVVDLGSKNATRVEPERIEEQLRQFQPQALQFFFGPRTVASCKTVVLFINKSDLLPGTPAEVEAQAKHLYSRLINDLMKYAPHVEVRVLVGSASYGHSTHHLFAHFVDKILPKSAYDPQLLQRMQDDLAQIPEAASIHENTAHGGHYGYAANGSHTTTPVAAGSYANGGANGANGAGAKSSLNGAGAPRPGQNGTSGAGSTQRLSG